MKPIRSKWLRLFLNHLGFTLIIVGFIATPVVFLAQMGMPSFSLLEMMLLLTITFGMMFLGHTLRSLKAP